MRSTEPKDFRSLPSASIDAHAIKADALHCPSSERENARCPSAHCICHQCISASIVAHWYIARKKPAPTPNVNSRLCMLPLRFQDGEKSLLNPSNSASKSRTISWSKRAASGSVVSCSIAR